MPVLAGGGGGNLKLPRISLGTALVLVGAMAPAAHAGLFTFVTPSGSSTAGGSVNASATVTTGAGTVTIVLNNLQANINDVTQAISDFDFVLSNGATTGTLASSSGQDITVNADHTFSLGSISTRTGWQLNNNVAGGLQLSALGGGQPDQLIIGPPGGATYSNANGSIAGNGPHNPFTNLTASFLVNVAGVTADTRITRAVFSFGTTAGIDVPGIPGGSVPEPTSVILLGSVLLGITTHFRKKVPRKV